MRTALAKRQALSRSSPLQCAATEPERDGIMGTDPKVLLSFSVQASEIHGCQTESNLLG